MAFVAPHTVNVSSFVSRSGTQKAPTPLSLTRGLFTPTTIRPRATLNNSMTSPSSVSTSLPSPSIVQIGCGTDLHGQDATTASVRACRNAIEFNSLPALSQLLPGGDLSAMKINVKLGVPAEFHHTVDVAKVKQQFPYGQVSVTLESGGLTCSSGIVLLEQGDAPADDRAVVVVAAVSVFT